MKNKIMIGKKYGGGVKTMKGSKTVITSVSIIVVALFIGTAISPAYAMIKNMNAAVSEIDAISEPSSSNTGVRVPLVRESSIISESSTSKSSDPRDESEDLNSASASSAEIITNDETLLPLGGSGDESDEPSINLDSQSSSSASSMVYNPSAVSTSVPGAGSNGGPDSSSGSEVTSSTYVTTGNKDSQSSSSTPGKCIVHFEVTKENEPMTTVTTDSKGVSLISLPPLKSEVDASLIVNVDYKVISGSVKETPYFIAVDDIDPLIIDEVRLRAKIVWLQFEKDLKELIEKEILKPIRNLGKLTRAVKDLALLACIAFDVELKDIAKVIGSVLDIIIPDGFKEKFRSFMGNIAETLVSLLYLLMDIDLSKLSIKEILGYIGEKIIKPILVTAATIGVKVIEGAEKILGQTDYRFIKGTNTRNCNKFIVKTDKEAVIEFTIKSGGSAMFNNGQDTYTVKVVSG